MTLTDSDSRPPLCAHCGVKRVKRRSRPSKDQGRWNTHCDRSCGIAAARAREAPEVVKARLAKIQATRLARQESAILARIVHACDLFATPAETFTRAEVIAMLTDTYRVGRTDGRESAAQKSKLRFASFQMQFGYHKKHCAWIATQHDPRPEPHTLMLAINAARVEQGDPLLQCTCGFLDT